MKYDPAKHHRNSVRLKDYDYGQSGAYFLTIVTQDRTCLFGDIKGSAPQLNDAGQMIRSVWVDMSRHYPGVETDTFVVMPNHFHGIVMMMDRDVGATGRSPFPSGPSKRSLGAFVGGFKSVVTTRINHLRGTPGVPVWQRNYYEHIIRDEESLNRIRQYIADNPARWEFDPDNPETKTPEAKYPWREKSNTTQDERNGRATRRWPYRFDLNLRILF